MYKWFCAALAVLGPSFAAAGESCGPRDVIAARLQADFGEALAATGLQDETQVMEIWASDTTGSFTVLVTRADGTSCVVATGTDFLRGQSGGMSPALELAGKRL